VELSGYPIDPYSFRSKHPGCIGGSIGSMDDAEGFFPERRLLAYRRSLLSVEPVSASTAKKSGSTWWILFVCSSPSYFAIWASTFSRHPPEGRLVPILIYGSYFLAAGVLICAAVGLYRGLRIRRPGTSDRRD
jgi:hypothetical protein